MKQDLIIISEKFENKKCKTHNKVAAIKVVKHAIVFSCCCDEFYKYLERRMEHETFMHFNPETDWE
jgi:hypothetical protein